MTTDTADGREGLLRQLRTALGEPAVLTADADVAPYAQDHRRRYQGRPLAVVRPADAAQVAAVVELCARSGTGIVPQSGNTGLSGGATPDAGGGQVILSLSRLNRIRAVDVVNNTLTAEAGCVLANVQQAAEAADRYFPLSLASEGSCEIGGNLSTNAGGTAVLRYGNMRELALGLEVVLPSGEIWNGLRGLRKDNTGYDLKQLFIGAEGTLGIITAAVLKVFPRPRSSATAVAALNSPRDAMQLLGTLQSACGERLTAFELFSEACLQLVLKHYPACRRPFGQVSPQYVLVELTDTQEQNVVVPLLEQVLGEALEKSLITDAATAASLAQARDFWALRENISEAQAAEGLNIKHDLALPISSIADFIEATESTLMNLVPGVRLIVFGHLGDGNLHYNVQQPIGQNRQAFLGREGEVNKVVYDQVARFGGSISAEHGLGQLKRETIKGYKSALELEMMRKIKAALDPKGIMNPGKVL
ncbi:MAG TPA: FAD-binding oxidoreductase [Burkholderiales bacterium]|nr:FAD-binding oxidoreductase [Burkholderiales bacterium]